jgi:hypothetical protein
MKLYRFTGIVYTIAIAAILTTTIAISPLNLLQLNNASAQQQTNPNMQTSPNPTPSMQGSNMTQANSSMNLGSGTNNPSTMNQASSITGSISIFAPILNAFKSSIHTSLDNAITTAQSSLGKNATTLAAFIHPDKGFIVYEIFALDANNNIHKIIVDPGNGRILSSQQMSLIEMMLMLHSGMGMGPGMANGMMSHGMGMGMGPGMANGMMSHGMGMNQPWHQ